ncbi:MAG: hypothetical protein KBC83_04530 [Candidatus Moranbacteria bacterium]|nr:hypothetical protein [Candidatus Moranbacteria bacterium]MBP9801898.1 hypothetical protein [Candidatus Moranbacteria bacterium]
MRNEAKFLTRRQVPESDGAYQSERALQGKSLPRYHFGSTALEQYEKGNPRFLQKDFEILLFRLQSLLEFHGGENRKAFVQQEMNNMFGTPELQAELRTYFQEDLSDFSVSSLRLKIKEGLISTEFLSTVARQHAVNMEKKEHFLQEAAREIKTEFAAALREGVSSGFLPEIVLQSLSRIESATTYLRDTMGNTQSMRSGELASCQPVSREIGILSELVQESSRSHLRNALFHEFLHIISGQSITMQISTQENTTNTSIFLKKTGVKIAGSTDRYTWLNEAITEWLASKLSGYTSDPDTKAYKGSLAYIGERKELDRLLDSGLEESTVIGAYFENFPTNQPRALARLIKRINELEGTFGFAQLENKQTMNNILTDLVEFEPIPMNDQWYQLRAADRKDLRALCVTISVGAHREALVERKIVFLEGRAQVQSQFEDIKDALADIQSQFGRRVRIVLSEE